MNEMTITAKMPSQWVIWLMVAGFAYVSGNQCNPEDVAPCFEDLLNYDTVIFPLYGHNESQLEDVCDHINASFDCIRSYSNRCHGNEECDENCTDTIKDIHSFLAHTGLNDLADDLCNANNPLRQTYLENIDCLEKTADMYAACHNDSQQSQHYIKSMKTQNMLEVQCCYFSWYKDCFTNATQNNNCGVNATIYVSVAEHKLYGKMREPLCMRVPIVCDRPPLPPEGNEIDNEIDKGMDKDMDKDKPGQIDNDIDNSIDKSDNTAATLKSYTATIMILTYVYTMMSKYIL